MGMNSVLVLRPIDDGSDQRELYTSNMYVCMYAWSIIYRSQLVFFFCIYVLVGQVVRISFAFLYDDVRLIIFR